MTTIAIAKQHATTAAQVGTIIARMPRAITQHDYHSSHDVTSNHCCLDVHETCNNHCTSKNDTFSEHDYHCSHQAYCNHSCSETQCIHNMDTSGVHLMKHSIVGEATTAARQTQGNNSCLTLLQDIAWLSYHRTSPSLRQRLLPR